MLRRLEGRPNGFELPGERLGRGIRLNRSRLADGVSKDGRLGEIGDTEGITIEGRPPEGRPADGAVRK